MKLWEETQWINLVHYRSRWGSGYKSQADGINFFLAGTRGKRNPREELEATLRGFFYEVQVGEEDNHPQCRFPARFLWLESQLKWEHSRLPPVQCPRYTQFVKKLAAESATLVFSSYYLNNPASAFGHTLIRLNKAPGARSGQRSELLDHGINYAAVPTTTNPLLYAVMGMAGFFPGVFTNVPYFYKVREYNNFESRDLWEYDLNLTHGEIQMLVAHFWEMGNTHFDYYYLTENCSYHMLTAIEAAAPQYSLVDPLPYYVIPVDTLKVAYEAPGLISELHYRPSTRTQFDFRLKQMSDKDRRLVTRIVSEPDLSLLPPDYAIEKKAEILDAAIDYVDFRYAKDLLKEQEQPLHTKQKLLVARSRLPVPTPTMEISAPKEDEPHRGHGSARLGGGHVYADRLGSALRVSQRFALHDLMDPLEGYPDTVEIEFLDFDLRYNFEGQDFWLENFSLFNVFSLTDFNRFYRSATWKFRLGATTFRDQVCNNCLGGIAEGGIGLTKKIGARMPVWATLMLDGEVSGSPDFLGTDARVRYGPMAQIRTSFFHNFQLLLKSQYRRPLISQHASNIDSIAQMRWGIIENIALDLQVRRLWRPDSWEGSVGLFYYY